MSGSPVAGVERGVVDARTTARALMDTHFKRLLRWTLAMDMLIDVGCRALSFPGLHFSGSDPS